MLTIYWNSCGNLHRVRFHLAKSIHMTCDYHSQQWKTTSTLQSKWKYFILLWKHNQRLKYFVKPLIVVSIDIFFLYVFCMCLYRNKRCNFLIKRVLTKRNRSEFHNKLESNYTGKSIDVESTLLTLWKVEACHYQVICSIDVNFRHRKNGSFWAKS